MVSWYSLMPALKVAQALGVPMVFARKLKPVTLSGDCYQSSARSHTKGELATLHVSCDYLSNLDRVAIIDDFLGTGEMTGAMLERVEQSGAALCGVGYAIEKLHERGRRGMVYLAVPVISPVRLDIDAERIVLR